MAEELNRTNTNASPDILSPEINEPEPSQAKAKPSDLEKDADARTKVNVETDGNDMTEEQKARLQQIVNLSHKREMDNFEPNKELVSEIVANKNNVLKESEINEFNKSMERLDPAKQELNESVDKFNERLKELGGDKILGNENLSDKQKKEQLDKLFEENPDFAELRDKMIEKQLDYRKAYRKTESIMSNFMKRDGKLPKEVMDQQKKLEEHPNDIKKPEEGASTLADMIARSISSIGSKIKRLFKFVFGGRTHEANGPDAPTSTDHNKPRERPISSDFPKMGA